MSEPEPQRIGDHLKRIKEKRDEKIAECQRIACKLRDSPYESMDEFREDLYTLCDKLAMLRDEL